MSKRQLILEASSPKHLLSHYPHNPYCDVCIRAHMKQRRVHRTTAPSDDGLPCVSGHGEQLSADTIVIARASGDGVAQAAADGSTYAFTIRDSFSGMAMAITQRNRTMDSNYAALTYFQGASSSRKPDIVVKSDAAPEITGAVKELG